MNILRLFERAAVLQKVRDAGRSEGVIANRRGDADSGRRTMNHAAD
jgi:hypothetical protein